MVLPAGLLQPRDDGGQEVVQWSREAAGKAELEKRQLGIVLTLALDPPVVISVGLDSLGLPAFTVTLENSTTPPAAAATTDNSAGETTAAAPAPAPTAQATQATDTGKTTAATDAFPLTQATANTPVNTATPDIIASDTNTPIPTQANTSANTSPALVDPSGATLLASTTGVAKTSDTAKITATGQQTTTEVIFAGGSAITSVMTVGSSATAVASNKSTSPPVIAGAVVGSIGGTALLLLLLVMFLRWRRHRNDNKRFSQGGESIKALHTGPAPIMPHNSARTTVFPPPPDPTETPRMAFLPAGAAGWLNRLSGSPLRSDSPAQEQIRELSDSYDDQSFQKVAGRKVPSQFPNGTEEGPVATQFNINDPALAPPPPAAFLRPDNRDSSRTASNQLLNNDPEWFNSVRGPPSAAAARSVSPVSAVSPAVASFSHVNDRPHGYEDAGNPFAGEQASDPVPAVPHPPLKPARSISFIPSSHANNSANTSADEAEHEQIAHQDFGTDSGLRPGPNRMSEMYGAPPSFSMPHSPYNSTWATTNPQPPDPGFANQQSWYTPYSPDQVGSRQNVRVESMNWPEPPTVDWERLSRVRPKGI